MNKTPVAALAFVALATACQAQGGEEAGAAEAPAEILEGVTVFTAALGTLRVTYPVLGQVRTPGTGPVVWRGGGEVSTVEVVEGDIVAAGQALASLDCAVPSLNLERADVSHSTAVVARDRAARALARLEAVADSGGATLEALDQAAVALAASELEVEGARVSRDLAAETVDDCALAAPYAARVEAVVPRAGETVSLGSPFAILLPLDGLRLEVGLVPELAAGLDGDSRLSDSDGLAWTLFHVGSVVDPVSGSVTTLWRADGQVEPADGIWVDGAIVLEDMAGIILPVSTLVDRMGRGVWIVEPDDSLSFRLVEVLAEEGGNAVVSGVESDERVVLHRPGRMEEGQRVRVIPS